MKVIKINGAEVAFDRNKIIAAITKASNACEQQELTQAQVEDAAYE